MRKKIITYLFTITSLFLLSATTQASKEPLVNSSVIFGEKNGLIGIEAEHFYQQSKNTVRYWYINGEHFKPQVSPDFDQSSYADASGQMYIEALPDTYISDDEPAIHGENVGEISGSIAVVHYKIQVDNPGRYYIWSRIRSNDEEDNTISAGIDDQWPDTSRILQFTKHTKQWQWSNTLRISRKPWVIGRAYIDIPTQGVHDFQVSMREDGAEVDRFILTRDEHFSIKEGTGPAIVTHAGELPRVADLRAPKWQTKNALANPLINPDDSFYGVSLNYLEREGFVTFEAENFYRQQKIGERMWHLVQSPSVQAIGPDSDEPHLEGASGAAYLELLPDVRQKDEDAMHSASSIKQRGGEAAVLTYWVNFKTAGRYYVWVRALAVDGDDNTLHVGVDENWPDSGKKLTIRGKTWTWNNTQRDTKAAIHVDIDKPGNHKIQLSMREDGCELDAILLTQNPAPRVTAFDQLPSFINVGNLSAWQAERGAKMTFANVHSIQRDAITIEVESAPASQGWQYIANNTGHSGVGFYRWQPEGQGIKPGQGILKYTITIAEAGRYHIQVRSKIADPTNRIDTRDPDGNDVWLSFEPTGATAVWKKLAVFDHPTDWVWDTHEDLGAPHKNNPFIRKLLPGTYELTLSGRSQGFQIDAIRIEKK